MSNSTKRIISTMAIVIASVAFGVLISADLGLMPTSNAQTAPIQTAQGPRYSTTSLSGLIERGSLNRESATAARLTTSLFALRSC